MGSSGFFWVLLGSGGFSWVLVERLLFLFVVIVCLSFCHRVRLFVLLADALTFATQQKKRTPKDALVYLIAYGDILLLVLDLQE